MYRVHCTPPTCRCTRPAPRRTLEGVRPPGEARTACESPYLPRSCSSTSRPKRVNHNSERYQIWHEQEREVLNRAPWRRAPQDQPQWRSHRPHNRPRWASGWHTGPPPRRAAAGGTEPWSQLKGNMYICSLWVQLIQLICEIQQHFSFFTFSLIFYVTEVALSMPCLPAMLPAILLLVT